MKKRKRPELKTKNRYELSKYIKLEGNRAKKTGDGYNVVEFEVAKK